jgi:hypothetical protein
MKKMISLSSVQKHMKAASLLEQYSVLISSEQVLFSATRFTTVVPEA